MDIRKEYLEFFKSKGHEVISSMPLVPDDPTLMFTNAGMVQFKDIFTGAVPKPETQELHLANFVLERVENIMT